MTVKFSVVTVVLNDLEGLKKTRESLIGQDYQNFEWIVWDGESTDNTLHFLQSMQDKVKWRSKKDSGIYDAMNQGVSMAGGDYVVFMNAGDVFFDKETLAKVAEVLAECDQSADILYSCISY